jgi:hypothetical protein
MTQKICPVCNFNDVETVAIQLVDGRGRPYPESIETECCGKCAEWIEARNNNFLLNEQNHA